MVARKFLIIMQKKTGDIWNECKIVLYFILSEKYLNLRDLILSFDGNKRLTLNKNNRYTNI